MKNLIPFSYEDTEIRAVEIDGEPWLVAKDICDYFGVSNRNRLLQQVDSLDKGGTRLDTPGGTHTEFWPLIYRRGSSSSPTREGLHREI